MSDAEQDAADESVVPFVPNAGRTLASWRWRIFWFGCALPFALWPMWSGDLPANSQSLISLTLGFIFVAFLSALLMGRHAALGLGFGGASKLVFGALLGRVIVEARWGVTLLFAVFWLRHVLLWGERLWEVLSGPLQGAPSGKVIFAGVGLLLIALCYKLSRDGLGKIFRNYLYLFSSLNILFLGLVIFAFRVGIEQKISILSGMRLSGSGLDWNNSALVVLLTLPLWLSSLEWSKYYGHGLVRVNDELRARFFTYLPLGYCLLGVAFLLGAAVITGVSSPEEGSLSGGIVAQSAAFGGVIGGCIALALEINALLLLMPLHVFFAPQQAIKAYQSRGSTGEARLLLTAFVLPILYFAAFELELWASFKALFLLFALWLCQCVGICIVALAPRFLWRYCRADGMNSILRLHASESSVVQKSAGLIACAALLGNAFLLFFEKQEHLYLPLFAGTCIASLVFVCCVKVFMKASQVHTARRSTEMSVETMEEEPTEGRTDPGFYFEDADKSRKTD